MKQYSSVFCVGVGFLSFVAACGGGKTGANSDSPRLTAQCLATCTSFATSISALRFDPSSCTQFTYPDDGGPRAGQRNTCFMNGGRVEERRLADGAAYEMRIFKAPGSLPSVVVETSLADISVFNGATSARLLRASLPTPDHVKVECDGQALLTTVDAFKECLGAMPVTGASLHCSPGTCS